MKKQNNISFVPSWSEQFIKDAVKANPDAKWKVMMGHHDLYSGRLPHRESENALLRMIWGPLCDEFGIDLMLLGHSHYYTVTNVLYNNKTVQPYAKEMVDPEGTVYMVSGSINRPRDDDEIGLNDEWIGSRCECKRTGCSCLGGGDV